MALEVLRKISDQPVSNEFENTVKLMKDAKGDLQDSINDLLLTLHDSAFMKDPSIVQFKDAVIALNKDELFKFSEFLMLFEALSVTKSESPSKLCNAAVELISAIDQLNPPVKPSILAEFDNHLKTLSKSVPEMVSGMNMPAISGVSENDSQISNTK